MVLKWTLVAGFWALHCWRNQPGSQDLRATLNAWSVAILVVCALSLWFVLCQISCGVVPLYGCKGQCEACKFPQHCGVFIAQKLPHRQLDGFTPSINVTIKQNSSATEPQRRPFSSKSLHLCNSIMTGVLLEVHHIYVYLGKDIVVCECCNITYDLIIWCPLTSFPCLNWAGQICACVEVNFSTPLHQEREDPHCSTFMDFIGVAYHLTGCRKLSEWSPQTSKIWTVPWEPLKSLQFSMPYRHLHALKCWTSDICCNIGRTVVGVDQFEGD